MKLPRLAGAANICLGLFLGLSIGSVQAALVAVAGPDQFGLSEGGVAILDGSGSFDTGGLPLTFLWEQTAGPGATIFAPLADITGISLPFVGGGGATLSFQLTVDNGIATDTDLVDLIIKPLNTAPTAKAGTDQSVFTSDFVTLDGSGSFDPESNPLTYLWQQTMGDPVTLSDATAVMPTFTAPGIAQLMEFRLIVNDGEFNSQDFVQINVSAVPLPPAVWLFGTGLVGLIGLAKRRTV